MKLFQVKLLLPGFLNLAIGGINGGDPVDTE